MDVVIVSLLGFIAGALIGGPLGTAVYWWIQSRPGGLLGATPSSAAFLPHRRTLMSRTNAGRQKRPLEHVVGPATAALEKADMKLIRDTYAMTAEFQMPFLPGPKQWERAAGLAERGLLKCHDLKIFPPTPGCDGYSVTQAGIDAYNDALRSNAQAQPTASRLAQGEK